MLDSQYALFTLRILCIPGAVAIKSLSPLSINVYYAEAACKRLTKIYGEKIIPVSFKEEAEAVYLNSLIV